MSNQDECHVIEREKETPIQRWMGQDNFVLSAWQKSIISGSLLGDGCLSRIEKYRKNSRFSEGHSIKQKGWLLWKQKQLLPISSSYSEGEVSGFKCLGNNVFKKDPTRKHGVCHLVTTQHPLFTVLERKWYKRDGSGNYIFKGSEKRKIRIKFLPSDFILDQISLSVFYLDDGCNNQGNKTCDIAANAFTEAEVNYLLKGIHDLGIRHAVIYSSSHRDDQFRIRIPARSYLDFLGLVGKCLPDLPKCMLYKVDTSSYRKTWIDRPEHKEPHPFDDALLPKILEEVRNRIPQRVIARKYGVPYKYINMIIRGKSRHKITEFINNVPYHNSTGIWGVTQRSREDKMTASRLKNGA